jgi:hypothetical protein
LGLNDEIKTNSIKEPRQKIRNKKNKNWTWNTNN